jgi:predicted regulator of Ras-like GTPase activity (Roadblock/LC7/MglB family)
MLHNIVIITLKGGVVKYKREFLYPVEKAQMLAGLFITQMKIIKREMWHTLSYVEVDKSAITIVDDEELDLACVCFHDVNDGWEFGQLLATQILLKYVEANRSNNPRHNSGTLQFGLGTSAPTSNNTNSSNNNMTNTTATPMVRVTSTSNLITPLSSMSHTQVQKIEYNIDQAAFHSKLPDAFRSMTKPIMFDLTQQRGIEKAAFVAAQNSSNKVLPSLLADWNLEAYLGHLISTSNDLMGGSPQTIIIDGDTTNIQVIQVAPSYHLVVHVLKHIDHKIIDIAINRAAKLLKQVYDLLMLTQNNQYR